MLGTFKSLFTTLKIAFRPPVTLEYPTTAPVLAPRFMAHPVLTWDEGVHEPYCTGCLVCMRICPTDCITVSMKDNPKFAESESTRRKIVDDFELNVADCIMCGLCVEYCNFDAILMSDHFDASQYARPELVLGLDELIDQGKGQEAKGRWSPPEPKKPQRRAAEPTPSAGDGEAAVDPRVAESRRRVAEIRAQRAAEAGAAEQGAAEPTPSAGDGEAAVDPRVAESRRRVAEIRAQRAAQQAATDTGTTEQSAPEQAATEPGTAEQGAADSAPSSGNTDAAVDPRVAEGRRRAAEIRAQRARERAEQPDSGDAPRDTEDAD